MTTIIKEVTTSSDTENAVNIISPTTSKTTNSQLYSYLIYYFFGIIETLLIFRFILKIVGANPNTIFVELIYGLTRLLVLPFEGIIRKFSSQGIETTSIIEPSIFVAVIVYAMLAIGIVKLIRISYGEVKE